MHTRHTGSYPHSQVMMMHASSTYVVCSAGWWQMAQSLPVLSAWTSTACILQNIHSQETFCCSPSANWNLDWSTQGQQQWVNPPCRNPILCSIPPIGQLASDEMVI